MEEAKPRTRRRHGSDLKARVLEACAQPGASVAQVALDHGLNANLVHKWRRQDRPAAARAMLAADVEGFVPLPLGGPVPAAVPDIRIEMRRGATSVSVTWPASAAAQCAVWMRDLLK